MSEDQPIDKPRKVYKKIYRKKGYNCDGSKRAELTSTERAEQIYNLRYGRICMAFKMEGLKPPDKNKHRYMYHTDDDVKGKTLHFAENRDGKTYDLHLRVKGKKPKKAKTTNYFYY